MVDTEVRVISSNTESSEPSKSDSGSCDLALTKDDDGKNVKKKIEKGADNLNLKSEIALKIPTPTKASKKIVLSSSDSDEDDFVYVLFIT